MRQVVTRVASCGPRFKCILAGLALVTGLVGVPAVVLIPSATAATATGGYPYWKMPCVVPPYGTTGTGYWCAGYNWGTIPNNTTNASELSPYGYDYRNCTDYVAWKLSTLGVRPAQY